jgi:hypothetical protein
MVARLFGCSTYVGTKLGLTAVGFCNNSTLPSRTDSENSFILSSNSRIEKKNGGMRVLLLEMEPNL